MSDTPVTLDGSSGPSPEGSVAPSTPKKPWHTPLVITGTLDKSTEKHHSPIESTFTSEFILNFSGPS